jgi:hypothetical protein
VFRRLVRLAVLFAMLVVGYAAVSAAHEPAAATGSCDLVRDRDGRPAGVVTNPTASQRSLPSCNRGQPPTSSELFRITASPPRKRCDTAAWRGVRERTSPSNSTTCACSIWRPGSRPRHGSLVGLAASAKSLFSTKAPRSKGDRRRENAGPAIVGVEASASSTACRATLGRRWMDQPDLR